MKLFGNSKSSRRRNSSERFHAKVPTQDTQTGGEDSRISRGTKYLILLACAAAMFVFCVILVFTLIGNSAEPYEIPTIVQDADPVTYQIDSSAPVQIHTELDVEPPVSKYDSAVLNLLIMIPNDTAQTTDAIMILSVDTEAKTCSLLSIPRDTYIAGDYPEPKIMHVYHAAQSVEKGVQAMMEMVKGMFGFMPDHYLVLDKDALSLMVEEAGELRFDVPDDPDYSQLPSGERVFSGSDAIMLFSYDKNYTDVETEPARVQRTFLQILLDQFLNCDDSSLMERCIALKSSAYTDLNERQLAYYGVLLRQIDLLAAYSRALPGGEIEVDETAYYQVNSEKALEIINEQLNPMEKDLDEFDINFRQLTGDSGDGEYSDYGFSDNTESTEEDDSSSGASSDDDEEETTEETGDSESTESTEEESQEESTDSEETDFPTEPLTEAPTDTPAESDTTETP